jgi:cytochrome c553
MRHCIILILLLATACEQPKPPPKPVEAAFDGADASAAAAVIAHGERISWALGCRGCHRANLQGGTFYERYASNLTRDLPRYTDSEIERVLRTGVPRDGRELWGMPSEIFQHLSAADMRALIANLRSAEPGGQPTQPPKPWAPDAQELIEKGEFKSAKDTVHQDRLTAPVDLGPKYALGRYITRVTCAECHGPKLEGSPDSRPGEPPDLVVAGGYTRAEFETLLTEGVPPAGRKLKNELMGDVARKRFAHLTPHERDAIYSYLQARAEKAQ